MEKENPDLQKQIAELKKAQEADQKKFDALAEKAAALLAQKEASQKEEASPEIQTEPTIEEEEKETPAEPITEETPKNSEPENPEIEEKRKSIWNIFRKKEKNPVPLLSEEEVEKFRKEAQESEEKKQAIRESILNKKVDRGEIETRKSSFYGKANKGLDWLENLGKDENGENQKGVKGVVNRSLKTGINLALIGAISFVSVEKAAEMGYGTATALGKGPAAYLLTKIGIGTGISLLIHEGQSHLHKVKKIFNKENNTPVNITGEEKERIKKRKKIIKEIVMIGITAGAGAALTGGMAVPLAALSGIFMSKLIKTAFSEEKNAIARKNKMERILKKYKPENLEGDLEKIQNEITEKIGQWEERRKFWIKVARGAAALVTSIAVLEASGFTHDTHDASAAHDTHDQENNLGNQEGEKTVVDKPDETNPEEVNPETQPEEAQPEETNPETNPDSGGTDADTQPENNNMVDNTEKVQEFMKTSSTRNAIDFGKYDPEAEAESFNSRGGTLSFEDVSGHRIEVPYSSLGSIKTIQNLKAEMTKYYGGVEKIPAGTIDTHFTDMQGDVHDQVLLKGETFEKIKDGDMFNSAPAQEQTSVNQDLTNQQINPVTGESMEPLGGENLNEQQINPVTGEPMEPIGTENIVGQQINPITGEPMTPVGVEHLNTENLSEQQINPVTGEPMEPIGTENNSGNTQAVENNINQNSEQSSTSEETNSGIITKENPYGLSTEQLTEAKTVYENNLSKLFPNQEAMETWKSIADSHNTRAEIVIDMNPAEVKPEYSPLVSFMQKLKEVTGLEPLAKNLIYPGETNSEYILRAAQKAAELGQLDKIKL
jgi:hypothetical protein